MHANLSEARLGGAELVASNLSDVEGRKADFQGADLSGSHLNGSRFPDASFRGATLTNADLSHGQFAGADFKSADLEGAKLYGADLSGARGLNQDQLDAVCADGATRLPSGLWAPKGCHGGLGLHVRLPLFPAPPVPPVPPTAAVSVHHR